MTHNFHILTDGRTNRYFNRDKVVASKVLYWMIRYSTGIVVSVIPPVVQDNKITTDEHHYDYMV